jgi:hypothetical protein
VGAVGAVGEQPILAPDHEGLNRPFGGVVVDGGVPGVDVAHQARPLPAGVSDRLAEQGLRRHAVEPGEALTDGVDDGFGLGLAAPVTLIGVYLGAIALDGVELADARDEPRRLAVTDFVTAGLLDVDELPPNRGQIF